MNNNERKIGIIGFGVLGQQIATLLEQSGFNTSLFCYFDDQFKHKSAFSFNSFREETFSELEFIVAIGYKHLELKDKIVKELILLNRKLLTFIHPTSFINPTAKISKGVIIYPMCNIDQHVIIDDGVLLNNSVIISHNCNIGSACYFSPGVTISGNVSIGSSTFIGSGSIISNGLNIGKGCSIGIGTVLTKDVPDYSSVIGNPARILDKKLNIL